jgi:AcrR family transcriptional regulator
MPTQTFFNLPEEKRRRIVEAATAEFAANPLAKASIAAIVEAAGIPRGSFYQYFDGIEDAYKYTIQLIAERKMEYMRGVTEDCEEMGFFQLMRKLYCAGLGFAADQPELALIASRFFQEDEELKHQIYGELGGRSTAFFRDLLIRGLNRGEIDPGMDLEVASFMLLALNTAIIDHFLEQRKVGDLFDDMDDLMDMADQMLHILQHGMGAERTDVHDREETYG